jgi:dienelactone hydrolase
MAGIVRYFPYSPATILHLRPKSEGEMNSAFEPNMLGAYGPWAAALAGAGPAALSWRRGGWPDVETWRTQARARVWECLAPPDTGGIPDVQIRRSCIYDGLHIEELAWQLPYGPPTEAILLKPQGASGPLPGVLALHDHSGHKYFGKEKIADTGAPRHPAVTEPQAIYGGVAWANALAKRGYVVLVPDAFGFGSRRVRLADVPPAIRPETSGTDAEDGETPGAVDTYNEWSSHYESIMAKSLLCAGTTWAGVWLAEDQRALDVLCARPEVDHARVGCGGLSGGGLRTCYLGGMDERIACAVCVGMMTTWRDYLLNTSYTHTWMIYVPHLPRDLDYPEIFGLRAPRPALVLDDIDDDLFTLPEMRRADAMLRAIYADTGGSAEQQEHYRCSYYPGPHKFDLPMQAEAFDWFDRWLAAPPGGER